MSWLGLGLGRFPAAHVDRAQRQRVGGETDAAAQQEHGGRGHRPGLLALDQPVVDDFLGEQVGVDRALGQALQRQAVGHAERQQVLLERGRGDDLGADQPAERLELLDLVAQALREVAAQAGQFHGVAQRHDPADLRRPVEIREVADGALQLGQQIAEHRPHRLEHGLGIGGRRGVALQVLGLGEGEFQLLRERLGEVAAAQGNGPLPDAIAVADHQVGGVGAQRDDHHRLGRIFGIVLIGRRQFAQLVEAEEVVEHQRRKLDDVDLDVGLDEGVERAEDGVALHGEQADLGLQGEPFLLASHTHEMAAAQRDAPLPHPDSRW